jgi:hypothetical protein
MDDIENILHEECMTSVYLQKEPERPHYTRFYHLNRKSKSFRDFTAKPLRTVVPMVKLHSEPFMQRRRVSRASIDHVTSHQQSQIQDSRNVPATIVHKPLKSLFELDNKIKSRATE